MDVNKLLKALENENNENLMNFTTLKLKEMNRRVLKELPLSKETYLDFVKKLQEYKFVDELNDLKYGTYIRWIVLNNPKKLELTKGAIFCETKITDEGIVLVCKGFYHSFFQIKMDDCLVFQHLTNEEKVLLNALDYLAK
jgi:hypothetical protein